MTMARISFTATLGTRSGFKFACSDNGAQHP